METQRKKVLFLITKSNCRAEIVWDTISVGSPIATNPVTGAI